MRFFFFLRPAFGQGRLWATPSPLSIFLIEKFQGGGALGVPGPVSSSYAKVLGETNFHTREFPRSGPKAKDGEKREKDTPGTAGGPGGRDRTLAIKSRKTAGKNSFFS